MNGFTEPLPGLLDASHAASSELPTLSDFHVPPLRDPLPLRTGNAPPALEPVADQAIPRKPILPATAIDERTTPLRIAPGDIRVAPDAKKPSLAISELLGAKHGGPGESGPLPSFISLAVVEKSPVPRSLVFTGEREPKRPRLDEDTPGAGKKDYRHLPRPAQKEESTTARPLPLLPAMVAGLHEPPQSTNILPSMKPEALGKPEGEFPSPRGPTEPMNPSQKKTRGRPPELMLNSPQASPLILAAAELPLSSTTDATPPHTDAAPGRPSGSDQKPARRLPKKWSDLETEQLMAGVKKYGIGKWKEILRDPDFTFGDRSTVDLKDRFRVCLPQEYKNRPVGRGKQPEPGNPSHSSSPRSTSFAAGAGPSSPSYPAPRSSGGDNPSYSSCESRSQSRPHSSPPPNPGDPAHPAPVSQPHRRKRRPWLPAEDAALMLGVSRHGFQWTLIHEDADLKLGHRKATDLRDRIRNKFPDGYRYAETAPRRAERAKEGREDKDRAKPAAAGGALPKAGAGKSKDKEREPSSKNERTGNEAESAAAGLTLPPITLEDGDWDWGNNTLAPLLDWEDIGI